MRLQGYSTKTRVRDILKDKLLDIQDKQLINCELRAVFNLLSVFGEIAWHWLNDSLDKEWDQRYD